MTDTAVNPTTVETLDLYREVHKGIRLALFDLCRAAGTLDPDDPASRAALVVRFAEFERMLTLHHEHEDGEIFGGFVATVAPQFLPEMEAAHESIVATIAGMRRAVIAVGDGGGDADQLYDQVAAFVADYLSHMAFEEHQVMPALAAASTFDELLAVQIGVRTAALPDEVVLFMRWMLPAANPDERVAMLGGLKANVPAEAFEVFWATATDVLSPADLANVARRIGH